MIQLQLAGGGGMTVAFLGDGHGHNRHFGLGQGLENGVQPVDLRMQRLFYYTHHPALPGIG
ncbi:hypothetical protein D3C80_2187370 [compost metagenome]